MQSSAGRRIARIAWAVPIMLLLLSFQQIKVTRDLGETMRLGTPGVAHVTRYKRVDRKDVTQAEIDLEIERDDGTMLEKKHMALPYSIAHRVEDKDSLDVLVLPGAAEEVVISSIVATQKRIAFYNVFMSLIAFVMAFIGIYFWNRQVSASDRSGMTE